MWGWQAGFATLQFLRECEWPYDELGPDGIPVGISWLEISIAIMLKLGTYLPVQRKGSDGETYLVFVSSLAAAQMHHTTLVELAQVANSLYHQVLNLIPERMTPDIPEGRVKSLYMLGESFQGTGLLLGPSFPGQERVVQLAQEYIISNRTLLDLGLQGCDQWPRDQRNNQMKWDRGITRPEGWWERWKRFETDRVYHRFWPFSFIRRVEMRETMDAAASTLRQRPGGGPTDKVKRP